MEQNYNLVKKTEANLSNLLALQAKARKIKKDNRIKIDISKSEYPLLRNVPMNDLGWKIWTREQSKQEVSVYWMDTYVPEQHIKRMRTYQRINHFPASQNLGKKNLLTANLNRMKRYMSKEFAFYPQTFNFPSEAQQFQKFKYQQSKFFIVKPGCDSQGRGIYLTRSADISIKEEMVVQEYVENPLLIEGMKFDLRIYVLLKSVNPLKIYIYQEGLSRLATCSYEKPSTQNQKNMRMHLTNYAINKFSPNFIFNKSEEEDHIGHKRSYTATMKAIERLGCNIQMLQTQIDKIIVKTIMSTYQNLNNKYKQLRDIKEENESICFQILGFDILIKDNFEPLLLEVNHSPSFATDSPLDLIIKKCLILDTLNILNLNHQEKVNYLKNKNDHDALHIIPQTSRNNRSMHIEPEEIGAYRKIYPLQNCVQNQQVIKIYENVFKNCRIQKLHRPSKVSPNFKNPVQKISEIFQQNSLSLNSNSQTAQTSFTLYNVLNNLKISRLKKNSLEQAQQKQANPIQFPETIQQKVNIFESDIDASMIRKEQLLSYERKIRKDKQKERKKYVLPMPLNNINIKLDQKYFQTKREAKSNNSHYYITPDQNYVKIHSYFNSRGLQTERASTKEKGNQTADGEERLPHFESFRKTHLVGFSHISEDSVYSSELKQKLERMHFVRLRIQKSKKMDKGSYVIIKNNSSQRKQSRHFPNNVGFK